MSKYGTLDTSRFSALEMRMYFLIQTGLASKMELEEYYTLDEALKLYALIRMKNDIEAGRMEETRKVSRR